MRIADSIFFSLEMPYFSIRRRIYFISVLCFLLDLLLALLPDFRFQQLLLQADSGSLHGLEKLVQHGVQTVRCILSRGLRSLAFRGQHPLLRVLDHPHIFLPGLGAYHVRHDLHRLVIGRSRNIFQQGLHIRNFQGQFVQPVLLDGKLLLLLGKDKVLLLQIFVVAVFCFFLQFQPVPLCNLKQHFPTGSIESNLAVVAAAERLVRVRRVEAKRLQCLFLLGSHLAVLVLAVEHMTLVDVGCAFVQMQCPVQHMNVFVKLGLELLNELGDDVQQVLCRGVFIQRSQLIDGFFRAGLAAGQQVGNGAVALCVPDLGVALVLAFDEGRVVGLVELPFYIREGRRQIVRVGRRKSRAEAVKAVPIDVTLCSFRVNVLTVSKVETAVVVLGVISAVDPGSSIVSC